MAYNYYKPGAWNVICDRCALEFKSDELRREWTGLMVCGSCWEPRHEQDLLRVPQDTSDIPWSRPEPTDTFVLLSEVIYTESGLIITEESEVFLPMYTET